MRSKKLSIPLEMMAHHWRNSARENDAWILGLELGSNHAVAAIGDEKSLSINMCGQEWQSEPLCQQSLREILQSIIDDQRQALLPQQIVIISWRYQALLKNIQSICLENAAGHSVSVPVIVLDFMQACWNACLLKDSLIEPPHNATHPSGHVIYLGTDSILSFDVLGDGPIQRTINTISDEPIIFNYLKNVSKAFGVFIQKKYGTKNEITRLITNNEQSMELFMTQNDMSEWLKYRDRHYKKTQDKIKKLLIKYFKNQKSDNPLYATGYGYYLFPNLSYLIDKEIVNFSHSDKILPVQCLYMHCQEKTMRV